MALSTPDSFDLSVEKLRSNYHWDQYVLDHYEWYPVEGYSKPYAQRNSVMDYQFVTVSVPDDW